MERSIQLARKRDTIDLFPGSKETRPDIVKKNTVGNSNNLIGDIGQSTRPLSPQAI